MNKEKEDLIKIIKMEEEIHIKNIKEIQNKERIINRAIEYIETENSIGNEIEYTTRLLDILRGEK